MRRGNVKAVAGRVKRSCAPFAAARVHAAAAAAHLEAFLRADAQTQTTVGATPASPDAQPSTVGATPASPEAAPDVDAPEARARGPPR